MLINYFLEVSTLFEGNTYKVEYCLLILCLFTGISFSFNICPDGLPRVSLGRTIFVPKRFIIRAFTLYNIFPIV